MDYLSLFAGTALLFGVYIDFLYTTLSCNGSGKLTAILNKTLARLWMPRNGSVFKNWLGLLHLFTSVLLWVILLILGSFLIFKSHPDWVINSTSKVAATTTERLYYTIYIFTTLGNGDFIPGSGFSRIFTGLLSVGGFAMLTMSITYLLSVINAAISKKNLASNIWSMGNSPLQLYRFFTTGDNFNHFHSEVPDLIKALEAHANQHLAFPIVHFFLSKSKSKSLAVQTTSLYECLQKIKANTDDPNVMAQVHRMELVIADFLNLASNHLQRERDEHSVKGLRQDFLANYPNEEFDYNDSMVTRLSELLDSQGWQYAEVYKVQG